MKKLGVSRYCVIRGGQELYVHPDRLTAAEREEIAERRQSPEARRRFGMKLREVRRIEDKPLNAAIKLLRQKMARGEPDILTGAEKERLLNGAPEYVREKMLGSWSRV